MTQRYKNIPNTFIYFEISPFISDQESVHLTITQRQNLGFDPGFLEDQIRIYPKARLKIPSFTSVYALFTPRSFEQSSAEAVARYKAMLSTGQNLLDLSGGLGVDDWAFAQVYQQVTSIDIDAELNKLVRENFRKLGALNITRLDVDAYEYVDKNVDFWDCIYLDADRRVSQNRSFKLAETEPNILTLLPKLLQHTHKVWLKVSPIMDITALCKELPHISTIRVIAWKNEVRELLVELTPQSKAVPEIIAVDLHADTAMHFSSVEASANAHWGDEGTFLYEPSVSIIKSGLTPHYLGKLGIAQLAVNSMLGVSNQWVPEFMGRSFKIDYAFPFGKSAFTAFLKQHQITHANITKRNFPAEVADIRKQFKIADGGDRYLFLTTNQSGQKMVYVCSKAGSL